jgi:ubiquinone/menaquinone biosynthesis C-methylase UbiE
LNPGSTVKVDRMDAPTVPNHHHEHPPFKGLGGLSVALVFLFRSKDRAELAASLTDCGPGDVVVDIGCGSGAIPRHAAQMGATVIGVDPALPMLRVARVASRHPNARFVEGNAEALPVGDGAASIVWSIASVHHWRDLDRGISEVRRVVRPGGRFLVIENRTAPDATGLHSHGWTRGQARTFGDLLAAAGFSDIELAEHDGHRPMISVRATSCAASVLEPG